MKKNFELIRWALFGVSVVLLVLLFQPAIGFSISMFSDPLEDMMYGWAVPFIAGYMIWQRRELLASGAGAPNLWGGIPACLLGVLLFWLGNRGGQARLMQFGLVWIVFALPLVYWGWGTARHLVFPAGYLVLAIPMSFLDQITFPLRLWSSGVSALLLSGIGIDVTRVGTALVAAGENGFKLDVADPCSGIRSLIALLIITAGYAGIHRFGFRMKTALTLSAVPLAFAGNVVRLFTTGLVSQIWGEKAGILYHDQAGFIVFPIVVLASLLLFDFCRKNQAAEAAEEHIWQTEELRNKTPWRLVFLAALAVFFGAAFYQSGRLGEPVYENDAFVAQRMPEKAGAHVSRPTHFCQNEQCLATTEENVDRCPKCGGPLKDASYAEIINLPPDTRFLKTVYHSSVGKTYRITMVVSGKSRASIHRPEMCLPGQGFSVTRGVVETIHCGAKTFRVNSVTAARPGENPIGMLYWFANSRQEMATHWERIFQDVWDRTVHNRMNRWVMVTVNTDQPFGPEELRIFEEFLSEWYPKVIKR